jgi:formylglycine-generating enzyme required for sulfatase activity
LIAERLDMEPDLTIRRALVLALGQFTAAQLAPTARGPLVEKLLAIFENEPDAGLHGAAELVLRKWHHGKRLEKVVEKLKSDEKQLQARQSSDPRHWYVNSQQETFAIVDARDGVFLMGSPESEPRRFPNEGQHRVHLGRRFAISTKEITREQYERFQKDRPEITRVDTRGWAKTGDCPQTVVNWYDAVSYCNWLSEREGIPKDEWCYEPNKEGKFAAGMKPKDRFWELAGYRLPTEAEWEYACRAGTITPRYYGLDEKLLPYYAWDLEDSDSQAFPTGILEPNDWGLFDMAGNAYEWCFDQYADYPKETNQVFEDRPSTRPVEIGKVRVMRGGSFTTRSQVIRSADRDDYAPEQCYSFFGFRPVRTYP